MDAEEARGLTIKTLKERYKEEIKEICNLIYSCAEDGKTIASTEFENKPEAKSIAFYFQQKGFITAVQLKKDKCFADAFKAGGDCRINSVWHKVEDIPQHNAWLLAQIGNYCFYAFIMQVEYNRWERWCKGFDIVRWAYIEDLLPNTEGLNL